MRTQKLERNEIKYKYSKHEVVWAKISGYPWWPASITCTPSKTNNYYKVDFIGDSSYAFLSESKIAKYAQFREQYQFNKKLNKNFMNAVTIAANKYQKLLMKKSVSITSKGSVEYKTSQQKQQLNHQIQFGLIRDKIQQFTTQNQNKNKIQQQKIDFEQSQNNNKQPLKINENNQNQKQIKSNEMQQQIVQHPKMDRQKMQAQLLMKYLLHDIPSFRQIKKNQIQDDSNQSFSKKLHWKRKMISKQKNNKDIDNRVINLGQEQLTTRKIFKALIIKFDCIQIAKKTALSLKDQVLNQQNKVQCLKKVIQWILMSQSQNIINYYSQWSNFYKDCDRERQKLSSLTIQGQSQEQNLIK